MRCTLGDVEVAGEGELSVRLRGLGVLGRLTCDWCTNDDEEALRRDSCHRMGNSRKAGGKSCVSGGMHHRLVTDAQIGRAVRALRHRLDWTQEELGRRAGCSASSISRIERGRIRSCSLTTLRRILEALDAWAFIKINWRGGELERLLDADHALLQERWASRKRAARVGWIDRQEISYNIFGERGAIDDLAYHPASRTLVVSELKTGIYDAQSTLAKIDEKERLAAGIVERFGWRVDRVVACLVVAEGRTNRRRIEEHPALFGRFDCRGWSATAWLRDPTLPIGGLLVFEELSDRHGVRSRRAGRQRVRHPGSQSSVGKPASARRKRSSVA